MYTSHACNIYSMCFAMYNESDNDITVVNLEA